MLSFGSADSKGVTSTFFVSADSKRVNDGRLDKGREDTGARGYTPGDLRKSAEVIDCRRVGETLILRSAQEYESNGFMISLFLRKTERVKQEGERTEQTVSTRKE